MHNMLIQCKCRYASLIKDNSYNCVTMIAGYVRYMIISGNGRAYILLVNYSPV